MSRSHWQREGEVIYVQLKPETYIYIENIIEIYFECLRSVYYHRAIKEYFKTVNTDQYRAYEDYFYTVSYAIGVIKWAKLFGNERSQDCHFSYLTSFDDLRESLSQIKINENSELLSSLLNNLGIEKNVFDDYKEKLLQYRDQFVAHKDLKFYITSKDDEVTIKNKQNKRLKSRPKLDIALKSLYWLYDLAKKIIISKKSESNNCGFRIYDCDVIKKLINYETDEMISTFSRS